MIKSKLFLLFLVVYLVIPIRKATITKLLKFEVFGDLKTGFFRPILKAFGTNKGLVGWMKQEKTGNVRGEAIGTEIQLQNILYWISSPYLNKFPIIHCKSCIKPHNLKELPKEFKILPPKNMEEALKGIGEEYKGLLGDAKVYNEGTKTIDKIKKGFSKTAEVIEKAIKGNGEKAKNIDKTTKVNGEKAKVIDKTVKESGEKTKVIDKTAKESGEKTKMIDKTSKEDSKKTKVIDKEAKGSGKKAKKDSENQFKIDEDDLEDSLKNQVVVDDNYEGPRYGRFMIDDYVWDWD